MSKDSLVISQIVLCWFAKNKREFPWRETQNPYYIFLAEVLLRRTQASRVVETYEQLVRKYPTPEMLSQANIQELRRTFEFLGLTKRADLLVESAKIILKDYGGQVPRTVNEIATLPGMGIYSSRAVACLAFNEPVPMIDESVGRLLRRALNIGGREPAYSDKRLLKEVAQIIPLQCSREFNLGLLDIAAAYCHHKNSDCKECPLHEICFFYLSQVSR